jgi:uncharacterized protein YbjT (DUF2867 family)
MTGKMNTLKSSTSVVIGGSGAVGRQLIEKLLAAKRYERIYLILRASLGFQSHPVIQEQISSEVSADKMTISEAKVDLFCTLGSTLEKAGSIEAFIKIDRDLVIEFARWAKQKEFCAVHVVSYVGADSASRNYYSRTKGEMENQLIKLDLSSLTIYRPSLLHGAKRKEFRLGEALGFYFMQLFSWLPFSTIKKYKPVSVSAVANVMVKHSMNPPMGVAIISSEEMHDVNL